MSTGEGISRGSCAEDSTGVDECGYIRPAAVEEPPFCV